MNSYLTLLLQEPHSDSDVASNAPRCGELLRVQEQFALLKDRERLDCDGAALLHSIAGSLLELAACLPEGNSPIKELRNFVNRTEKWSRQRFVPSVKSEVEKELEVLLNSVIETHSASLLDEVGDALDLTLQTHGRDQFMTLAQDVGAEFLQGIFGASFASQAGRVDFLTQLPEERRFAEHILSAALPMMDAATNKRPLTEVIGVESSAVGAKRMHGITQKRALTRQASIAEATSKIALPNDSFFVAKLPPNCMKVMRALRTRAEAPVTENWLESIASEAGMTPTVCKNRLTSIVFPAYVEPNFPRSANERRPFQLQAEMLMVVIREMERLGMRLPFTDIVRDQKPFEVQRRSDAK